jgi:MFS family permease
MRSLCGLLNGNVGVVKSMLGEMTDSTNRGQAFSYWESAYGLGSIFGPVLGGLLVNPAKQFPGWFGENALFIEYPYLLPCMVSSIISVIGATVGFIYMEETSPIVLKRLKYAQLHRDSTLVGISSRNYRDGCFVEEQEPLLNAIHVNLTSEDEEVILSETEQHGQLLIHRPELERIDSSISIELVTLREIITNQKVIWGILSYATWCLITIIYEEVYALYVSEPLFKGGLELNSFEIGVILSFSGFVQFTSQILLYPRIERYLGLIGTFRLASVLMVVFAIALPFCTDYARYLVSLHDGGYTQDDKIKVYILLSSLLAGKTLAAVIGYIPVIILVNDSAPTPGSLGTVHGCGQVAASLMRSLGPTIGGVMWSWSLTNFFPFDFHFTLFFVGLLSVFSVGISVYIEKVFYDIKGH